jgi:hypothetical protein
MESSVVLAAIQPIEAVVSSAVDEEALEVKAEVEAEVLVGLPAVAGLPVCATPVLAEEHLQSRDVSSCVSQNFQDMSKTYCEPVQEVPEVATSLEDFFELNTPPITPPTIPTTRRTSPAKTIRNSVLDMPQYLRAGKGDRKASFSSLGATALG